MTRLPTLHAAKVLRALQKAGFVEVAQKGSHRSLWNRQTGRQTTIPVHGRDIPRGLMKQILKQAGLSERDFRQLI